MSGVSPPPALSNSSLRPMRCCADGPRSSARFLICNSWACVRPAIGQTQNQVAGAAGSHGRELHPPGCPRRVHQRRWGRPGSLNTGVTGRPQPPEPLQQATRRHQAAPAETNRPYTASGMADAHPSASITPTQNPHFLLAHLGGAKSYSTALRRSLEVALTRAGRPASSLAA
jgi:hypothetical protein